MRDSVRVSCPVPPAICMLEFTIMKGSWLDLAVWGIWQTLATAPSWFVSLVVSSCVAFFVATVTYKRNVRPVVVFTKRRNGGAGPAINVIVGQQNENHAWKSITRYHSLPVNNHAELVGRIDGRSLAVKYSNLTGKWFSTTCIDSESKLHKTDLFPNWRVLLTEEDLLGGEDAGARAIDRLMNPPE